MWPIRLFGLGIAFLLFATGTSRAQFVVCQPKQQGQPAWLQTVSQSLKDRTLYLSDRSGQCWWEVKNFGLSEGTLQASPDDVQQFPARASASFAYLIQQPSYHTAMVFKERVFRPADVMGPDGKRRLVSNAVPYVILKRAAVQSVCDHKDDLDNFRTKIYGGNVKVDVNVYNRYHAQPYEFVPATDEIQQFHFKYPVGPACPLTNDPATRQQYVLNNLTQDPATFLISWLVSNLTASDTHNENRFVNGTETLLGSPNYTIVRFLGDAVRGTRSEITISDLQQQTQTSTWQIDWK
jgi:hypothetical protein